MALPWAQVEASKAYQALPPAEQRAARAQYFREVVAPRVPTSDLTKAWGQFTGARGSIGQIHASMPSSLQDMVQSRIRADSAAASTPEVRAQRFRQINAANVAAQPWWQTTLQGAGKSFVDDARGAGQLLGLRSNQDIAQDRQLDQALMDTTAGKVGDIGGSIAQTLPFGAVGGALKLGELPLLARIGLGAAGGAAQGALQPVTSDDERSGNMIMGGFMGGAMPLAGAGLRLAGHGIQHITNPGAVADRAVLRRFGDIAGDLRGGSPDPVPGVVRTPAQAAMRPGVIAEERTARSGVPGAALFARDQANDAARVAHLRQFAGDENTLNDALAERGAFARQFVADNIGGTTVDPAPILDAIKSVKRGTGGANSGVRGALHDVTATLTDPDIVDENGHVPLASVESLRQSLGGIARKSAMTTASPVSQIRPVIAPVRDAVHGVLSDAIPDFDSYLTGYRERSEPINTMRELQDLLDAKNLNADGSLSLARVNQFLKRDDRAPFGISADARSAVENVRDSLANETNAAQKVGPTGSNTTADASRALGAYIGGNPYGMEPGPGARLFGGAAGAALHPFGWLAGEAMAGAGGRALKGRTAPLIADRVSSAGSLADAIDRATGRANQRAPWIPQPSTFLGLPNAQFPLSFSPLLRGVGLQAVSPNGGN